MAFERRRAGVKRRLLELATFALEPLGIEAAYTWTGDEGGRSIFYLGVVEGVADTESIGSPAAQPAVRTDRFSVACQIVCPGHLDPVAAEEAAEEALRTFEAVLARARRLRDVEGCDDGSPEDYAGIVSAEIADVDGPRHSFPAPAAGNTVEGWVEFTILCRAHLG